MRGFCGADCDICSDFISKKCRGCRDAAEAGDWCFFKDCNEKHETEDCSECGQFPCDDIVAFSKEAESHREAYEWLCAKRGK